MTNDELRTWQSQRPFEPFDILVVDGRTFHVPHPEYLWVPPGRGTWVYVADPKHGGADHINTAVISSIRRATNGRTRRRKSG